MKVKWPGKRMSTVDMLKRVRQLMEWVGREQASHNEREKRRIKIEEAVADEAAAQLNADTNGELEPDGAKMDVDGAEVETKVTLLKASSLLASLEVPATNTELASITATTTETSTTLINGHNHRPDKTTAQLMEELMSELIGFQEKYVGQTNVNELMSL